MHPESKLTLFWFNVITSILFLAVGIGATACGSPPDDGDDDVMVDAGNMVQTDGSMPTEICAQAIQLSGITISVSAPVQFDCRVADMPPNQTDSCQLDCNLLNGSDGGFVFNLPLQEGQGTLNIDLTNGTIVHIRLNTEQLRGNFSPPSN
ncbi:MAG: hypothetical protein HYT15_01525 [Candidatus Magasanikbacteria bacterium]|nr:hypothetical protein [Candidatus Magasanikbacteria bacterium]